MLPGKYQSDQELLEQIVDRQSLHTVLHLLETICSEKADHIRTNYQDETLAQSWESAAYQLSEFSLTEEDL